MPRLTRLLLFVFFLLAGTGMQGCQKDETNPETETGKLLIGRWELTQSSGGIAGRTIPADPALKQEVIFAANGQVQFLLNGAMKRSSPYSVVQERAYTSQRLESFVVYSSSTSIRDYIGSISSSTLVLNNDIFDGFTFEYVRR